jgi:lactonase
MSANLDLASERAVSSMPLPPAETLLPQIKPEPWLEIDPGDVFLKGMAFDRDGNLFLMAAYPGEVDKSMAGRMDRSILKITPDKKVTTIVRRQGMRMCGHALHKDGRLFIACLTGELLVSNPDGSDLHTINSRCDGRPQRLNDLVFDDEGKLYVTDFTGYPGNATGGVYRWSADFEAVEAFMPNLVTPNGITFSADENSLWVGCTLANQLFRLALSADRNSVHQASVLYHLSGAAGADGMCVDVLGNMYLAINFQGRILIFNKYGIPIASVLMPGREDGKLLSTTNVAFKPGTNEVFVTASGETSGAWIFTLKGLAEGARLFSHR